MKKNTIEKLSQMVRDLVRVNCETGNAAALTLCLIQDDLNKIADGLVWGS